jgi:hypothetical protein
MIEKGIKEEVEEAQEEEAEEEEGEVEECSRKLHNEGFRGFYSSKNIGC